MPPAVQALACIQIWSFLAIPGLYKALHGWPVLIYELLLADWHTAPASSAGIPAYIAPGSARLYKAEDIRYRARWSSDTRASWRSCRMRRRGWSLHMPNVSEVG